MIRVMLAGVVLLLAGAPAGPVLAHNPSLMIHACLAKATTPQERNECRWLERGNDGPD